MVDWGAPAAVKGARARPEEQSDDQRELAYERRALQRAYTELREQLTEIAEGRSRRLPVDAVATFTRFYREHMLRIDTGQKAFQRRD